MKLLLILFVAVLLNISRPLLADDDLVYQQDELKDTIQRCLDYHNGNNNGYSESEGKVFCINLGDFFLYGINIRKDGGRYKKYFLEYMNEVGTREFDEIVAIMIKSKMALKQKKKVFGKYDRFFRLFFDVRYNSKISHLKDLVFFKNTLEFNKSINDFTIEQIKEIYSLLTQENNTTEVVLQKFNSIFQYDGPDIGSNEVITKSTYDYILKRRTGLFSISSASIDIYLALLKDHATKNLSVEKLKKIIFSLVENKKFEISSADIKSMISGN
ncbi:MAG: hypothetical protein HOE90_17720 [Bacteriovoracaceae bacterium]|nr:hypothetical protein [Bacteriovoracaceae bacterium]